MRATKQEINSVKKFFISGDFGSIHQEMVVIVPSATEEITNTGCNEVAHKVFDGMPNEETKSALNVLEVLSKSNEQLKEAHASINVLDKGINVDEVLPSKKAFDKGKTTDMEKCNTKRAPLEGRTVIQETEEGITESLGKVAQQVFDTRTNEADCEESVQTSKVWIDKGKDGVFASPCSDKSEGEDVNPDKKS